MKNMQYYNQYYENPAFWGTELTPAEKERTLATVSIIPRDVQSILDIGCGDGRITNILAKKFNVTAMDISREALKHVDCKKELGSINDIPFKDRSFDLVMATEVFEHLPATDFKRAIAELERISRKYILISVPYRENLFASFTRCQSCGKVYHLWQHQQSFTKRSISLLFKKFRPIKFEPIGPKMGLNNNILLWLKYHIYNEWNYSEKTLCPRCGFHNKPNIQSNNSILLKLIEGLEWRWNKAVPDICKHKNWILGIYEKYNHA